MAGGGTNNVVDGQLCLQNSTRQISFRFVGILFDLPPNLRLVVLDAFGNSACLERCLADRKISSFI